MLWHMATEPAVCTVRPYSATPPSHPVSSPRAKQTPTWLHAHRQVQHLQPCEGRQLCQVSRGQGHPLLWAPQVQLTEHGGGWGEVQGRWPASTCVRMGGRIW